MQKVVLIIGIVFLDIASSFSQPILTETEKLAIFCKIWGFLKYYHPSVAKGSMDWDKEFMTRIECVSTLNSKQEISNYYSSWINSLGRIKKCKHCNNNIPDSLKFNLDLRWLKDSTIFSNDLAIHLQLIQENRNYGRNYYVKKVRANHSTYFKNEKEYKDSIFPGAECRLLSLCRYWNIVNYFFPYKYVIGEDWNNILLEMIPQFKYATDTFSYHLALLKLITKINDGHAFLKGSDFISDLYGSRLVPFWYGIAENKVIVTGLRSRSLAEKDDVHINDVILKINNRTIPEIVEQWSEYLPASNYSVKMLQTYNFLLNNNLDSMLITFERSGNIFNKTIHSYPAKNIIYDILIPKKFDFNNLLDSTIGYVDLGNLKIKQVNKTMRALMNKKAIIFDVRNYPQGTLYKIAKWLNKDRVPFARVTSSEVKFPGVFKWENPVACGKRNRNYYKGKVVLLFNEITQSHAEYTCMALQTAPNVICIGSQTAGADGGVESIIFPGGFRTGMSGSGIYYPDGRETQRIGIVPDIEVKPTIKGIKEGRDELIEKALEVIRDSEMQNK